VNAQAVYRIALNRGNTAPKSFAAGTKIKTYFPSAMIFTTANGSSMSICRRYFNENRTTSDYSNCLYDSTNKLVTFSLPKIAYLNFDFAYEIGRI
jgi:hypothetical protein